MDFKEIDLIGEETLKSMSQGVRLNKWMFNQMKPYIWRKDIRNWKWNRKYFKNIHSRFKKY